MEQSQRVLECGRRENEEGEPHPHLPLPSLAGLIMSPYIILVFPFTANEVSAYYICYIDLYKFHVNKYIIGCFCQEHFYAFHMFLLM